MNQKKKVIQEILHQMTSEANSIQNYNFRHFFIRKTQLKQSSLDSMPED